MSFLSDAAIRHLRAVTDEPDLSGTKYRLVSALGRGGMGTVYLAQDTELHRPVALKVLSSPDPDGGLAARMTVEARILARLEHPGIVPIHDVGGLPDGRVFYVMKLVRGHRLDEHAASLTEPADALRIFQRLCEAVAFAHAHGVIHRDLKPQNIMVGEFGEVLVLDWGVARVLRQPEESVGDPQPAANASPMSSTPAPTPGATMHGTRMGTPGYMAPEQTAGDIARIDERADVYGLGAILGFLLQKITQPIPSRLRAIRNRALAGEPSDRYASATALAADVTRFLDGLSVTAYRENPFERTARFVSRYRTAIALVLTYMILRVLFVLFGQ